MTILLILCASGVFFSSLSAVDAADGAGGIYLPTDSGLPSGTIRGVVENFLKWFLGIFGFLALISFIVSGVMYFVAAGDDRAVEKAKNQMKWSIIGVIVGLMGFIIVQAVTTWLKGSTSF